VNITAECPKCGRERDVSRGEVVTGRWKQAPCHVCGHLRNAPSATPCDANNPMRSGELTPGDAR